MSILDDHRSEFDKPIEHLKNDLAAFRTGRANPALIENIGVAAYGSTTPLKQLGSISVSDARSMLVEPWDKSVLGDIEKAIQAANVGVSVANEGKHIRVNVPLMTEENRKDIVKLLRDKMEQARVAVRGIRDKVKESITEAEEAGSITEDEKFRLQKQLDELTAATNDKIKVLADAKETEIMTI